MTEDLRDLISRINKLYNSIGRIWCPILGVYVHFTSEGRVHLIYKGNRKKRPVKEQYYKLNLFPLSTTVLKKSTNIQSYRNSADGKTEFYAITCKVGSNKADVRVIVKRTGNGQFNYHSIMLNK